MRVILRGDEPMRLGQYAQEYTRRSDEEAALKYPS